VYIKVTIGFSIWNLNLIFPAQNSHKWRSRDLLEYKVIRLVSETEHWCKMLVRERCYFWLGSRQTVDLDKEYE